MKIWFFWAPRKSILHPPMVRTPRVTNSCSEGTAMLSHNTVHIAMLSHNNVHTSPDRVT